MRVRAPAAWAGTLALAVSAAFAVELRAEPIPPRAPVEPLPYRLVEPLFEEEYLQHATLLRHGQAPPRPGPTFGILLYAGPQSFGPGALLDAFEANGYRGGGGLTPGFGLMLRAGGESFRYALVFGGARVDIHDGSTSGSYFHFGMLGQVGVHVLRTVDYAVFPLAGVGFGVLGVNAKTTDPARTPILRGQLESLPDGFAVDVPVLLLELGLGAQTTLPLSSDGRHGIGLELQLVYLLQPLSPEWRPRDGPSIEGPSARFGGLLARLGVGWGYSSIERVYERKRVASCAGPGCEVICDPGFLDCDGEPRNGCETPDDTIDDCGGCGMSCALEHAKGACRRGRCAIARCAPGYASCDGDVATGCERDTRADPLHCGACGHACAGGERCRNGECEALPDAGLRP